MSDIKPMQQVYCSGPNNSTKFTRCCEVAIRDAETYCPGCGSEVYPGKGFTEHQTYVARNEATKVSRR